MSIPVVLYSDFVCPFCFVAERTVLLRLQAEFDVALDWRGFELHPDTPRGGISVHEFAGMREIESSREYTRKFAADHGIFDIVVPWRIPNTRRALAISELARDEGRLDEFRTAVMDARWCRGANIEDESVLLPLAAAAGLDPELTRAAIHGAAFQALVSMTRKEAVRKGVSRVPTFVIENEHIVGCRSYDVLARAAEAASGSVREPLESKLAV